MPQIIPIKDLKNTRERSEMCHKSEDPIFVTKNGYGDMVIMSLETFEKNSGMSDFYGDIKFTKGKGSNLKKEQGIFDTILRTANDFELFRMVEM